MAVSGDISVAQDGGQGNVKLHPYLVTLVRWCVSCLWSTATVLLHRLMTTPLQPITGPKPPAPPKPKIPKRVAGTEHLHPEPKVECQLLHQPDHHTMDVIFVHGLYGSLGNTWRQGDWRLKYKADPQKVPLRNHSTPNACNCRENSYNNRIYNENKCDDNNPIDLNDPEMSLKKINEKLSKKVIPEENDLITEQFYNNTLLDQVDIVDNYGTQAKFVSDLFRKEKNCDINCDDNPKYKYNEQENQHNYNESNDNDFKCDQNESYDFKCKYNEVNESNECKCNFNEKKCEMGCGCLCNDCYSTCWPRDWIKMDFPGARVISINYTSDPYLWRPLWIKENKRLNLYQRAEQMIEQLLEMGVGERPIIWVGHSKGGLFIKQIYCEAYDAYMETNKNLRKDDQTSEVIAKKTEDTKETSNGITAANIDTIIGHFSHNEETDNSFDNKNVGNNNHYTSNDNGTKNVDNDTRNTDNDTRDMDNDMKNNNNDARNTDINTRNNNDDLRNIDNDSRNINNDARNADINTRITDINTGNIVNDTRNMDNETRNIDINTRNTDINTRNSDINTGNTDINTGNTGINTGNIDINTGNIVNDTSNIDNKTRNINNDSRNTDIKTRNINNDSRNTDIKTRNIDNYSRHNDNIARNNACVLNETTTYNNVFEQINIAKNESARNNNLDYVNVINDNIFNLSHENGGGEYEDMMKGDLENGDGESALTSNIEEASGLRRASLWSSSRGFMFYSVPHRGSPLADIKTPVTARSVDLLEIAKDCPLVLRLQERWLRAARGPGAAVAVRGCVETSRTLMSVLWLRIVSTDSADAGIGTLSGVSVDHREICKPTSRDCLLYTELTGLIHDALKCRCQ